MSSTAPWRAAWSKPTAIGAYFDPIADKCLLSGVFLALGWSRMVPRWMVAIVLGRDLYILLAASACLLWTPLRKFPPSLLGKASTFMQISTVVAWLVRDAYGTAPLRAAADILMWLAASLAFASGFEYTIRGVRLLRAAPPAGRAEFRPGLCVAPPNPVTMEADGA